MLFIHVLAPDFSSLICFTPILHHGCSCIYNSYLIIIQHCCNWYIIDNFLAQDLSSMLRYSSLVLHGVLNIQFISISSYNIVVRTDIPFIQIFAQDFSSLLRFISLVHHRCTDIPFMHIHIIIQHCCNCYSILHIFAKTSRACFVSYLFTSSM